MAIVSFAYAFGVRECLTAKVPVEGPTLICIRKSIRSSHNLLRHLKTGHTSMISARLLAPVSQNFNVLSTFCGRKYVMLDVI